MFCKNFLHHKGAMIVHALLACFNLPVILVWHTFFGRKYSSIPLVLWCFFSCSCLPFCCFLCAWQLLWLEHVVLPLLPSSSWEFTSGNYTRKSFLWWIGFGGGIKSSIVLLDSAMWLSMSCRSVTGGSPTVLSSSALVWHSATVVAVGCRIASFAGLPSSFALFWSNWWHIGQNGLPWRHLLLNEWKMVQGSSSLLMVHELRSRLLH